MQQVPGRNVRRPKKTFEEKSTQTEILVFAETAVQTHYSAFITKNTTKRHIDFAVNRKEMP